MVPAKPDGFFNDQVCKFGSEKSRSQTCTLKPGSHIPPSYLQHSRRLQLTTFGDLSQWVPGASAMDRRRTQICLKCKSNCAIFNHFTSKYGSNHLTGVPCICRWCSHKIFSSLTIANNCQLAWEVELSSTSQACWQSMPGTDYVLAIKCSHMLQRCPGGVYVPGMYAYENQALAVKKTCPVLPLQWNGASFCLCKKFVWACVNGAFI